MRIAIVKIVYWRELLIMTTNYSQIKLGVLPTQRFNFGNKEKMLAAKNRVLTWLKKNEINHVSLEGVTDEGTLHSMKQLQKVTEYLEDNDVDALFVPHCNFGSEEIIANVAKNIDKPLLLWGEQDSKDRKDWDQVTDRQCGLFATSRTLQGFKIPFSYIVNCPITDQQFEKDFINFLGTVNTIKTLKNLRIGQIGVRPGPFLTMMVDERELLKKFNIKLVPTTITNIVDLAKKIQGSKRHKEKIELYKRKITVWNPDADTTSRLAAFQLALEEWSKNKNCNALVIQCWSTLQNHFDIYPCFINSEISGEVMPVGCESDIHGVITSKILEAAPREKVPSFFADLTMRHPENNNAELLWHCGPYPHKLIAEGVDSQVNERGRASWKIKEGKITLARFDGDNGIYKLLCGKAESVSGPETFGTYLWAEVSDWPEWEKRIINGPYAHHIIGIHADITEILQETCKYIPELKLDLLP